MSSVAIKYEDWIRECVRRDGQDGKVDLPCNIMLGIADWIEAHKDVALIKHGRWEAVNTDMQAWTIQCSTCKMIGFTGKSPYCPNCGARMDGEEE